VRRSIPAIWLALLVVLGIVLWHGPGSRPDATALLASGRARLDECSFDEARRDLEAALELEPDSARIHTFLAMSLAGLGRAEESFAHLKRAVELDPAYLTAHYNLGILLLRNGQLDEAEQCFLAALRLGPENAKVVEAYERLREARRSRAERGE